ncbi:uncharacterized protein LOC128194250 [Vigna angularis]|uniref:uncharacterized protein LOC128194250 n=1 Tax=Phaseolus angularis TaxID=3914 RepID=UPI0022B5038B|nr:uncharacterized protein LOC128194250 [Vigna angularis]
MASSGDDCPTTTLSVRHSFSTKYICTLNERLTKEHRSLIATTPFAWFLDVNVNVKVGRNILSELLGKWDDCSSGFIVGNKVLNINENDIYLGLGLSTDGANINLKEELGNSECVKYIGKGTKELNSIYKILMRKQKKKIPCSHFCSLYLLVGISEILFPKRSGKVFPVMFNVVDNLSALGSYCWGSLVYRFLLHSLCKASKGLKKGKGISNVYVNGCVYMLQVWFFELFVPPKGPIDKFPRILHWMNISVGDKFVKRCMETGLVVDDVYGGPSTKDKEEYRPTPKRKDAKARGKKKQKGARRETFMRALEEQEFLIEELKRRVATLEAQLAEEKARRQNKDDVGQSVPRTEPSVNTGFVSPTDIDGNEQPLKTYVRVGSRRRYKGRALRTPYTGTVVLRIKNE